MPMHDWTRVAAEIFHAFHHDWITELARTLNDGLLPEEYYALPEQQTAGFGPDVLAVQTAILVRHVRDDRIVAMLEVVSPGNKASGYALRTFTYRPCELLGHRIHLLIVDPLPPSPRDPNGIHAAIWAEVQDEPFALPEDKPLTLVAYECDSTTQAYIEAIAVGDLLSDMPLFLQPGVYVVIPLESTYQAAFAGLPRRWRTVLEPPAPLG